jgi:ankyrin repeat protein
LTALHMASRAANPEVVKLLLEKGVDIKEMISVSVPAIYVGCGGGN